MLLALLIVATRAESFAELLGAQRLDELIEGVRSGALVVSAEDRAVFAGARQALDAKLDELTRLVSSMKERQVLAPAFKWAQNSTDVFVQVKLSHRIEAPGCLDVSRVEAKAEGGRLHFLAECVQATSPLLFLLDFALFNATTAHELSPDSVGTYVLRLRKAAPALWPDIFAEPAVRAAHRSQIWTELESTYPEDMEAFLQLREEYFEAARAAPSSQEL